MWTFLFSNLHILHIIVQVNLKLIFYFSFKNVLILNPHEAMSP